MERRSSASHHTKTVRAHSIMPEAISESELCLSTHNDTKKRKMNLMENDDIESQQVDNIEDPDSPLVEIIENMLETSGSQLTTGCSIYKVPEQLRKLNAAAYTPRLVSIGPFHRGREGLHTMDECKLRYLKHFLGQSKRSVKDFVIYIKDSEERARRCYAETFKLISSDDFVKMILLDGAFIIEYLSRICIKGVADQIDNVLHKPMLKIDMMNDLILLENQLPFFVLEGLYELASPFKHRISFLQLVSGYFWHFNKQKIPPQGDVEHFTDLLRFFQLPLSPRPPLNSGGKIISNQISKNITATELRRAGVKFKASSSKCLLDIEFKDGMLEIPCFTIDDSTEVIFKNLMALEQCHYPDSTYICDYFFLLDSLINNAKDVDLLVENEIIIYWLGGSDEVATLINCLGKNIALSGANNFYYNKLHDELSAYYKSSWHRSKATLKRDYFNSPWSIISLIAAFVLLILTLIQTVCSIISVVP